MTLIDGLLPLTGVHVLGYNSLGQGKSVVSKVLAQTSCWPID
jgi:hypothetical protein